MDALTEREDVLIAVLSLASERARLCEAEHVDPEGGERAFVAGADGDLLKAENAEGAGDGRLR